MAGTNISGGEATRAFTPMSGCKLETRTHGGGRQVDAEVDAKVRKVKKDRLHRTKQAMSQLSHRRSRIAKASEVF